jgi:aspartyl/glutamyl-tRNA(Asn/Gln) amidotransferase C subunit
MTDRSTIKKISGLAGIDISGGESDQFAEDFRRIIEFVSALDEAAAEDAEPMVSPSRPDQFLRRDIPGGDLSETALSKAPNTKENFIAINRSENY